jgi:monoamine oxidase
LAVVIGPPIGRRRFLQGIAAAGATVVGSKLRPLGLAAAAAGPVPRDERRIVIVGSGIAGLGCAYRLWRRYGLRSEIYELNTERAGGRIQTLRGYFAAGQLVEEHAEFISSEHTETLALAKGFGIGLDNVDDYPPGTHPLQYTMRFRGAPWPMAVLNAEWRDWGWRLFYEAAFVKAPWPATFQHSTRWTRLWDQMSVPEWIETYVPGGLDSDFGRLCIADMLDEFGGPPEEQSALNLVYTLGMYSSSASGLQPHRYPELSGSDEKWHLHGGNDQLITGLLDGLPAGTVRLGKGLVALRPRGASGFTASFTSGAVTRDITADHVVLALPFTKLRQADLDDAGLGIPPLQRQAIDTEPLGSNAKLFLQFSRRIWNEEHSAGNVYTSEPIQSGWDATSYQPGAAEGILVTLPGGSEAADWGRRYSLSTYSGSAPDAMVRDYLAGWERVYPGLRAAYTGRSYYVWSSGDPHLLGAYSYFQRGQYTSFNGVQGVRRGNLHFCGEQTSLNFQGYVEGGLRSGYRVADEIISS